MARYIEADKLLKEFEVDASKDVMDISDIVFTAVASIIERQPTADVVEVKKIEIIRDDLKWWLETNTEKGVVYIPEFVVENMIKKITRTPKERGGDK